MEQDLVLNNVTAAQSGSYFVEAQSAIGCTSFGFYELTITDELPPVEATLEQTACEDGDLEFSATFIPGAAYEWRNPANGIFSTTPNPTIFGATADQNGTYTVTVSLNGCTSSDDTTVTVALAPIANGEEVVGLVNTPQSFNVVVNDVLASNNYTITVVDQPDNGSVRYDGAGVLTYTPNNGFRETDMLAYQICYDECPDLCDVALVTLYIRFPGDTCVITTVITPNGDGVNDEFVVSCLEAPFGAKPNNELVIFNQWGDKVYEAAPYKNDWQGTWNGRDLPDGTYFYIFNPGPGEEPQKGFVMIYR
jgi:gliding motility-associated-like protein